MTGNLLLPGCAERAWEPGEDYERRSSGLWVPAEEVPPPRPLGIGLFCGAGGMDLGLTYAGIHVLAASDGWDLAAVTYLTNLGAPGTTVHLVGELPEGSKRVKAWHQEHRGESVSAAEFFEATTPKTKKGRPGTDELGPGDGWIAQQSGHTVDDHACGNHIDADTEHYADLPPEEIAEKRDWFHNTYCLGGRDYDALPCEHFYLGDVCELTGEQILDDLELTGDDIAVVAGGPPCQGFSISGKRQKDDPRNELVFEFMRVVCEIHPKTFVMENVPRMINMVTKEGIPVLDALALQAEDGGMGTFEAIRQTLAGTAGVGAALRTKKVKSSKPRPGSTVSRDRLDIDEEEDDQLALDMDEVLV